MEFTYFLIALSLFLTYFFVVTIFGFFIFMLIDKNHFKNKDSLTSILKSFAIGVALHLCYAMIVISFRIFNFFTAYFPFIVFDVIFLIYVYFKTDIIKNRIENLNGHVILNYLKQNKDYFLILSVALVMQFLLQIYFIEKSIAIPGKDAYFYFRHIWFVHENGFLRYRQTNIRPPGYILMGATITSFIDDFYVFYYFIKFIPLFLMSINVLVVFVISKSIFKKKINMYFSLTIFLSFNYFFTRNIVALPSNLAVMFGYLLLLFLNKSVAANVRSNDFKLKMYVKQKLKDKNLVFIGLIFAGIFMAHILYFLYFLLFYLTYEILLISVNLVQNRRYRKDNLSFLIKSFFTIFSMLLFMAIFCIPAFICSSSYSTKGVGSLFNYFFYFFPSLEPNNLSISNKPFLINLRFLVDFLAEIGYFLTNNLIHKGFNDFFKAFLFELPFLEIYRDVYSLTLGLGIFVIVFGVFLKYSKHFDFNEKQNYLINFIRFTFIFLLLIITIIFFMGFIKNALIQEITIFYSKLGKRLFELFPGFWAIIFVLSVDYFFILIKKLFFKIKKTNVKPSKRLINTFKSLQLLSIIILSGFLYATNFKRTYYGTVHNYARAEALLFVGDYFNENPPKEKTIILLEDLEDTYKPYYILEFNNLEKELYDFSEVDDYDDFKDFFDDEDCEYVLFPKYLFEDNDDDEILELFEEDFDEIYENSKFIFSKIE